MGDVKTLSSNAPVPNKGEKRCASKALDVLQLLLLKLNGNGVDKQFLSIMELIVKFHSGTSGTSAERRDVANLFFELIKNSSFEEINALAQKMDKIFMPMELRKVTVKNGCITTGYELGRGGFGIVYLANLKHADGSVEKVAVKVPLKEKHKRMLLEEAKIMTKLNHRNIVKLVAFQKDPLNVAMEHMEFKNLTEAMEANHLSSTDLLNVLHDVVSGMEYFSGQKYVHRDLSCRNIFVNFHKQCKVGDFGMSLYFGDCPDGQVRGKEGILLMHHTSPESQVTQIFSEKSDVWSFGVLIWELYVMAVGEFISPFLTEHAMVTFLTSNYLPHPTLCPNWLFGYLTRNILNAVPLQRPKFLSIKKKFNQMLKKPYDC